MPISENFRKNNLYVSGGRDALQKKLEETCSQPQWEDQIEWNKVLSCYYISEEDDQLIVGYYSIPYGNEVEEAGFPFPTIVSVSNERLVNEFDNDPEKVKNALIIVINVDVDHTLTRLHSQYNKEQIKAFLDHDLTELENLRDQAKSKGELEVFMQQLVDKQLKNINEFLNFPEDTATVLKVLSQTANVQINIVSKCKNFVWIDLVMRMLSHCAALKEINQWTAIVKKISYGENTRAEQMLECLNKNLSSPGVIGYRVVCLVDDDVDNIQYAAEYGLARSFIASLKNNEHWYNLCEFLSISPAPILIKSYEAKPAIIKEKNHKTCKNLFENKSITTDTLTDLISSHSSIFVDAKRQKCEAPSKEDLGQSTTEIKQLNLHLNTAQPQQTCSSQEEKTTSCSQ